MSKGTKSIPSIYKRLTLSYPGVNLHPVTDNVLSAQSGKSRNCAFFGKSHETSGQFWKKSRNFVTISEREVTVGLRPKESTRKIKVTFDLRPKESIRKKGSYNRPSAERIFYKRKVKFS